MFVGVDVHKHSLYVCYYRRATDYRFQSYPFTRDGFRQFLGSLSLGDQVAIEAVTQAFSTKRRCSLRMPAWMVK